MATEHKSKTGKILKRGAKPTPRHKLCAAAPHRIRGTTPPQTIVVPSFLEMWLNDQDGDCVTAEEAFAKAAYSVMMGKPETKITDATVLAFCNKYNVLNGADLAQVMDAMISDGFQQDQGYKDGPYNSIDYSNEPALQNAISLGPVKIGIDANALPSGAGNANGWFASGGTPGQFNNEDHCVSLCGYGPSSALFQALGVTVPPSGFPAAGYLLYTWSTIGVVDHPWIMSTVGEAWIRQPTTPGVGPIPPPPVCPPGEHWDPASNACVPDGPTPPAGGQVVIPSQIIQVPGLFGSHHNVTIPGQTVPVTPSVGSQMGAIPPWLLAELHALCDVAKKSTNPVVVAIADLLCPLLPTMAIGGPLPPFILKILKFLCPFAAFIPPPYGPAIVALCALLPVQANGPCGGCQ